jgi:YebC/PmpR family DNA-binding regulatory protein
MAGHSQFKNIMYRKGAQDKKRAKEFAKISRAITVAVKQGGDDINSNPALRLAIQKSRAVNMPKDNIERAIKKAQGSDTENYYDVRYEGYGAGGVAVIVETLTDNRNRTAGNVRAAFSKYGGALGETNSVTFSFERVGEITYSLDKGNNDSILEAAIDAGADDCMSDENGHTILCAFEDVGTVSTTLENVLGTPQSVNIVWKPNNTISIDEEKAALLMKMINILEEDDDVQNVFANFELSEDVINKLTAA